MGSRGIDLSINSALDEGDGQRHAPADLTPGKRLGIHCVGGWVSPRAGLGGCGKYRLPPPPTGNRTPDRPARNELLHRLSHQAHHIRYKDSTADLL
jgi:hypothetical protein